MSYTEKKMVWTLEEFNQRVLQMKAMGLSDESIAWVLEEIIINTKTDDNENELD